MSYSLEELLAEEGFKGKTFSKSRFSFGSKNAAKKPINQLQCSPSIGPASGNQIRRETRSAVSQGSLRGELSASDGIKCKIQKDDMNSRPKKDKGTNREHMRKLEGKWPIDRLKGKKIDAILSDNNLQANAEEQNIFKDIHSNGVYTQEGEKGKHSNRRTKEGFMESRVNSVNADGNSLKKHPLGRKSFDHMDRKNTKIPEKFHNISDQSSRDSKNFEDRHSQNHDKSVSTPAIGEAAIRAIVSILNEHVRRFLKDSDYRTLLWKNCFSSLNSIAIESWSKMKVIENLEQTAGVVEKFVEGYASERDLKRASLQLSMITGLNTNSLKDEFTAGVHNSNLAACAHLYLSVTYSLQNKGKASANHILQVFCDSSFLARTKLLPELWDCIFLPHLSHLKVWYDNEVDLMRDSPGQKKNMEFLQKMYDEILDSGTYKFAVYYKDWLTGVENPSIPALPTISIPSVSFAERNEKIPYDHFKWLDSPDDNFSSQPMVCKKLYDTVFSNPKNKVVEGCKDDEDLENFDYCLRSSETCIPLQRRVTHKSNYVTHVDVDQHMKEIFSKSSSDDASPDIGVLLSGIWQIHDVNLPSEEDVDSGFNDSITWQTNIGENKMLNALPKMKNKKPTTSISELQYAKLSDSMVSTSSETFSSDSQANYMKPLSFAEGDIIGRVCDMNITNDSVEETTLFFSIPMEFTCPLTKKLFENPVTLETGQTFEQQAIKAWFNQGNKTCPVTGKNLESLSVPLPSSILKRVIDDWKFHHCAHLLALASQIVDESSEDKMKDKDEIGILVLEQLLTAFGEEVGIKNIKALMSVGATQFLLQRLEVGNLEEKTRVVSLLSFCAEASPGCRIQIAQEINKSCLLILLHSKNVKSIEKVVLLLTKLICLNREDVTIFLRDLLKEGTENLMDVLLQCLRSLQTLEKPLVAVLLLHMDLTVESQQHCIYRKEAVDNISIALYGSLTDESIRERCCEAMLILGGRFSFSGKLLIENWMLKQARHIDSININLPRNQDKGLIVDDTILSDEEEQASENWLRNLTTALLGDGEESFLEAISECLCSGHADLVHVCLITLGWLSFSLSSLAVSESQLSAFSVLISHLINNLENNVLVEHKTLSAMSLLNFSTISGEFIRSLSGMSVRTLLPALECRAFFRSVRKEISSPRSMTEVSWPAKQLYDILEEEEDP